MKLNLSCKINFIFLIYNITKLMIIFQNGYIKVFNYVII